jgi:hypothetical protein
LRAEVASLLTALPWRASNGPRLCVLLEDDDPEVIAAAAHTLAGHPEAAMLVPAELLASLRAHPNPWVRHVALELELALEARPSS